jgi:hypothetical protein
MERLNAETSAPQATAEQTGRLHEYASNPRESSFRDTRRYQPAHRQSASHNESTPRHASANGIESATVAVAAKSKMFRLPGEVFQAEAD